jgi:hypothetical protein
VVLFIDYLKISSLFISSRRAVKASAVALLAASEWSDLNSLNSAFPLELIAFVHTTSPSLFSASQDRLMVNSVGGHVKGLLEDELVMSFGTKIKLILFSLIVCLSVIEFIE